METFLVRLMKGQKLRDNSAWLTKPDGIITTGHSRPFAAWHVAIVTF
jgi:hypothetical protein